MQTFKGFIVEATDSNFNWATVNRHFKPITAKVDFDNLSAVAAKIKDAVPKAKYIPLMTKFFAEDGIHKLEDIGTTGKEVFNRYHYLKGRNALKGDETDLNKIQSFNQMRDIVDNPVHAHLFKTRKDKQGDYTIRHEDDDVTIYTPHNVEASSRLARDPISNKKAAWCTAIEDSPETFKQYDIGGGLNMMIPKHPKHPGEMYQYTDGEYDGQLKDEHDEDVDNEDIIKRFPKAGFSIEKGKYSSSLKNHILEPQIADYKEKKLAELRTKSDLSSGEMTGIVYNGTDEDRVNMAHKLPSIGPLKGHEYFSHDSWDALDTLTDHTTHPEIQNIIMDRVGKQEWPKRILDNITVTVKGKQLDRLVNDPKLYNLLDPRNQKIVLGRAKDVSEHDPNYFDHSIFTGDDVDTPKGPGNVIGFHKKTLLRQTLNRDHDEPDVPISVLHKNGKVHQHKFSDVKLVKSYDSIHLLDDNVRDHMDAFEEKHPEFKHEPKNIYNTTTHVYEDMGAGAAVAPVNNVGGGCVAGMGVGPKGEPGVYNKRKKEIILAMLSRVLKTGTK